MISDMISVHKVAIVRRKYKHQSKMFGVITDFFFLKFLKNTKYLKNGLVMPLKLQQQE